MPKTLIVPVDGSEASARAFACAQVLADHFDSCDLVLLRADLDDAERVRSSVEALAATAQHGSVRKECVTGDAAGAIVRLAAQGPDAVICMATHARGRVSAPMLGSVATEVIRQVDAPLVLVGPHCEEDWWRTPPRLVSCWTGEPSAPLLPVTESWSHDLDMDLSLLCVFHPLDVQASVDPDSQFAGGLAQLDTQRRRVHTVALHDDFPAGAIVKYARTLPASLLALTTRARHGLGRLVLGSVAMQVVHDAPCPVLIVPVLA